VQYVVLDPAVELTVAARLARQDKSSISLIAASKIQEQGFRARSRACRQGIEPPRSCWRHYPGVRGAPRVATECALNNHRRSALARCHARALMGSE
jgi:hypothetical protein